MYVFIAESKHNKVQSKTTDFISGVLACRTGLNIYVVFDFVPLAPLYEIMTISTKSELHNLLQCRQMRIEPLSHDW